MTGEVVVQKEKQEEVTEQQAFEAGFNQEPVETPAPSEEAAPEETPAPAEDKPEEPARNQWGYTDEEMKNLLSKAAKVDELERSLASETRKLYGKIGEYNSVVQQMQSANKGGSLTVPQLTHLKAEFPELADLLAKDFGEVQAAPAPAAAPAPTPAFDESVIDRRVANATLEVKKEFLSAQHPDWEEVKESEWFATWKAMQPEEKQQQIDNSQSIAFVIGTLTEAKKWREESQRATTKKTARLEQAITTTTSAASAPPAMDENEAMLAGWKAIRG